MDITEKILKKEAQIAAKKERIAQEQASLVKLQKELSSLKNLEIKRMLNEIDMPFDEVCKLLKTMRPTPSVEPGAGQ